MCVGAQLGSVRRVRSSRRPLDDTPGGVSLRGQGIHPAPEARAAKNQSSGWAGSTGVMNSFTSARTPSANSVHSPVGASSDSANEYVG